MGSVTLAIERRNGKGMVPDAVGLLPPAELGRQPADRM